MPLTIVQAGMGGTGSTTASSTGTGAAVLATQPSFPSTIGVGGATASSSGAGITFPATQSASTDANTLDDYEEGTWTPVITNGSVNVTSYYWQLGYYVKIGKNVFVSLQISVFTVGPISGNIRIDGLPFAAGNPIGYNLYSLYGSKYTPTTGGVVYTINGGDNKLFPYLTASYPTQLTASELGSGGQWAMQGWYLAAN